MPIESKRTDSDLIFYLSGEIDHHNTLGMREEMDRQIRATPACRIVLDLAQTQFCDSSALGLILGRVRVAQEEGKILCVQNPGARAKKILELCGARKWVRFI